MVWEIDTHMRDAHRLNARISNGTRPDQCMLESEVDALQMFKAQGTQAFRCLREHSNLGRENTLAVCPSTHMLSTSTIYKITITALSHAQAPTTNAAIIDIRSHQCIDARTLSFPSRSFLISSSLHSFIILYLGKIV